MMRPYRRLHDLLTAAQEERILRTDFIRGENEEFLEIGWVMYERMLMWGQVNKMRVFHGKDLIGLEAVERVESQAHGHIDYTAKFALGCEELVLAP